MSWDGYIDNVIGHAGAGNCDKACIIGIDGSSWTSQAHANAIKISGAEAATIGSCFKNKDFSPFMANGVVIEGVKYRFLRVDEERVVLAKMKDCGALVLGRTKTAVVIAHTPEGGQQGNTNKAVCTVVDYLETQGM